MKTGLEKRHAKRIQLISDIALSITGKMSELQLHAGEGFPGGVADIETGLEEMVSAAHWFGLRFEKELEKIRNIK